MLRIRQGSLSLSVAARNSNRPGSSSWQQNGGFAGSRVTELRRWFQHMLAWDYGWIWPTGIIQKLAINVVWPSVCFFVFSWSSLALLRSAIFLTRDVTAWLWIKKYVALGTTLFAFSCEDFLGALFDLAIISPWKPAGKTLHLMTHPTSSSGSSSNSSGETSPSSVQECWLMVVLYIFLWFSHLNRASKVFVYGFNLIRSLLEV